MHWFGEEVICPRFDTLDAVLNLSKGGHDHYGNQMRLGVVFQDFTYFETVHDRHHHI
jgi:hypothetical protein